MSSPGEEERAAAPGGTVSRGEGRSEAAPPPPALSEAERKRRRAEVRETLSKQDLPPMTIVVPLRFRVDVRDLADIAGGSHFQRDRVIRSLETGLRAQLKGGKVTAVIARKVDDAVAALEFGRFFAQPGPALPDLAPDEGEPLPEAPDPV